MARSPLHAALFGLLASALAACSLIAGGHDDAPAPSAPVSASPAPAPSPTGGACGGMAGLSCASNADYCHFEPHETCGAADQLGTCRPIPDVCTREYRPVCGCDGETYPNPCVANSTGVSVANMGTCDV